MTFKIFKRKKPVKEDSKFDDYRDTLTDEDIFERCRYMIYNDPTNSHKKIQQYLEQFNLDITKFLESLE
jgi:hypothetical protein